MFLLLTLLGFFSGSILYSALLPRLIKGVDVRSLAPDHNPGAANAFKYGGTGVGIAALACDLLKAYLPVRLAFELLGADTPGFALVLCAPVLGHAFSPFAHFHGGKAIAASFGALLALLPGYHVVFHLAFWYILFSSLVLIRPHAVRTILTFTLTALYALAQPVRSIAWGVVMICLTVCWRHFPSLHSSPFSLRILGLRLWPVGHKEENCSAE